MFRIIKKKGMRQSVILCAYSLLIHMSNFHGEMVPRKVQSARGMVDFEGLRMS